MSTGERQDERRTSKRVNISTCMFVFSEDTDIDQYAELDRVDEQCESKRLRKQKTGSEHDRERHQQARGRGIERWFKMSMMYGIPLACV